jgi:DNA-binding beta-propeller fold protein YncE
VAVDGAGNVYVADTNNHRVRKVEAGTGLIATVAGTWNSGYNGDGIPGTSAWLYHPTGLLVAPSGDLLIMDTDNYRVRKLDAGTGLITTVAGNGSYTYNGDNIPATSAQMNNPLGMAADGDGNLYIADRYNQRIREVIHASPLPSAPGALTARGQNEQVFLNWAPAVRGACPITSYEVQRANSEIGPYGGVGWVVMSTFEV